MKPQVRVYRDRGRMVFYVWDATEAAPRDATIEEIEEYLYGYYRSPLTGDLLTMAKRELERQRGIQA